MSSVAELLNQPIVLTMLSLAFGGYLANTIADRRARNNKRREKAIDFLAETAGTLNGVISTMYGSLRTSKPFSPETAIDLLTTLYSRRMNVRIASEAYLRSESFPRQYDRILHELQAVAFLIPALAENGEPAASVFARRTALRDSWPIQDEPARPIASSPTEELMLWLEMVLDRITALLSSSLSAVVQ